MTDLARLTTEARNPASEHLDGMSALEIAELINAEDAKITDAVAGEKQNIANAIDVIADRWRQGGRLVYLGAGTSGRLGVLDAAECPPTFNTPPERVVGVIAGGHTALTTAVEGAEDHPEFAVQDLKTQNLSSRDVLVGIATSGRTPYVIGGLQYAREIGAYAIGLSCNEGSALAPACDLLICPVVGPEVLSGSTRMKAGTATKLVLNMLTTGTMVRLGKTYGNLMVDLRATNAKLGERSRRIVKLLTGVDESTARELLEEADGELKTAIVVQQKDCSATEARELLDSADGQLRTVLEAS